LVVLHGISLPVNRYIRPLEASRPGFRLIAELETVNEAAYDEGLLFAATVMHGLGWDARR
jgi:hypothetical protein